MSVDFGVGIFMSVKSNSQGRISANLLIKTVEKKRFSGKFDWIFSAICRYTYI